MVFPIVQNSFCILQSEPITQGATHSLANSLPLSLSLLSHLYTDKAGTRKQVKNLESSGARQAGGKGVQAGHGSKKLNKPPWPDAQCPRRKPCRGQTS